MHLPAEGLSVSRLGGQVYVYLLAKRLSAGWDLYACSPMMALGEQVYMHLPAEGLSVSRYTCPARRELSFSRAGKALGEVGSVPARRGALGEQAWRAGVCILARRELSFSA
ncbi:UNVERIFIED_CONTAM: hypothetical protein RF649_15390, partial [Kocuria sp. CPCC 205295]